MQKTDGIQKAKGILKPNDEGKFMKAWRVYYKIPGLTTTSKGIVTREALIKFIGEVGPATIRNVKFNHRNVSAEFLLRLLRAAKAKHFSL